VVGSEEGEREVDVDVEELRMDRSDSLSLDRPRPLGYLRYAALRCLSLQPSSPVSCLPPTTRR